MNVLLEKVKEVLFTVLPVAAIVMLLHFTVAPLAGSFLWSFLLGAAMIVLGLSIFLFGIDLAIEPLGDHIGKTISKSNKIWVMALVGLAIGFFVSIAEPDLQILAKQVQTVTGGQISSWTILLAVSVGIAAMLVAGLLRIVQNFPLYRLLTFLYGIIAVLSLFVSPEFFAVAFDASGATTGALTVPFILALSLGISSMKKSGKASEKDSFGLVAVTSTGAILGVLMIGICLRTGALTGELAHHPAQSSVLGAVMRLLPRTLLETLIAVLPLIVIFLCFQFKAFRFDARHLKRILKGFLYTWLGLTLFLVGVHSGFMNIGILLGQKIGGMNQPLFLIAIGFLLGFVTVLAEPAVHVLTHQIEVVTAGYVKRRIVLGALSVGVGAAVAMSVIRILLPPLQLWHILLPGYALSIGLSYYTPKLFVGIGFDSGGVASGPMTATFILAFVQGVADAVPGANVLTDAFGMIALVAMMPIIAIQLLGLIVKIKTRNQNHHRKEGMGHA